MGQLMHNDKKAIIKIIKKKHPLRGILSAAFDSYIRNTYSQLFSHVRVFIYTKELRFYYSVALAALLITLVPAIKYRKN